MKKKSIFLAIALMVVGMTVVQAQTQAQQQELEQIARRSVNGLSPQDRQRVIQIMTDVYAAQGMSRQQAATYAEMAADTMFSTDIGEMTPEQRRQFEEQERRLAEDEQRRRQPQQPQQQQLPGDTAGWPTAQLRDCGLSNLRQPAGIQPSYNINTGFRYTLVVFMTGANENTLQDIKRQIETAAGRQMYFDRSANQYSVQISEATRRTGAIHVVIRLEGNQLTLSFVESAA